MTVKMTERYGERALKINGRAVYVTRITSIERASRAIWRGTASGYAFLIEGGKAAGGSSRDWWVEWDLLGGPAIHVNSFVDAVRLIENS